MMPDICIPVSVVILTLSVAALLTLALMVWLSLRRNVNVREEGDLANVGGNGGQGGDEMKILVIAGSHVEFRRFLDEMSKVGFHRRDIFAYASGVEMVVGIKWLDVVTYGTWNERSDARAILFYAHTTIRYITT